MPWEVKDPVEQRRQLVLEYGQGESVAELSRLYKVSRETVYKWIGRFAEEGEAGLEDRSRAPREHPQRVAEGIREQVLELRREHARWGPRKLKAYMEAHHPRRWWPATSTIGDWLREEGLAHRRRIRRRTPAMTEPLAHAAAPNQVWCADFKGWFRTADGERIDPLTVTDAATRYLLRLQTVEKSDGPHVRAVMETAFREYGLPHAIRTDNGPPFASVAPGGLSRLAMWWIRLGIRHERIEPGCPQQNGRHERFHLTLKQETASPPCASRAAQQRAFQRFQQTYNCERPHEALEYRTPQSLYSASARLYPARRCAGSVNKAA
jgi:transposase InsO family protein